MCVPHGRTIGQEIHIKRHSRFIGEAIHAQRDFFLALEHVPVRHQEDPVERLALSRRWTDVPAVEES